MKNVTKGSTKADVATAQASTVAVVDQVAAASAPVTPATTAAPTIRKHIVVSAQGLANRKSAGQRTAQGKFNKIAFAFIGGTECPKFAPMTWEARDKFMASGTPEANAVKARYLLHMTGKAPYQQKPGPVTAPVNGQVAKAS